MKKKYSHRFYKYLLLVSMFLFVIKSYGQTFADKNYYLIDSLDLEALSLKEQKLINTSLKLFHNAKHDTLKIKAINIIVEESWDDSVWPRYNQWLYDFIDDKLENYTSSSNQKLFYNEKVSLIKSFGEALNNMGVYYSGRGDFDKALEFYHKSLNIMEEAGYKKEIAVALNNIGYVNLTQGSAIKALGFYLKSLKIKESINDKNGIATSLNNIAQVYYDHGDIQKALEYNIKSLKIREELDDKNGITASLNNIGVIYLDQGNSNKALEYSFRSLKLNEAIGDKKKIVIILNNIGLIYREQGVFNKVLEYYNKALKISKENSDKQGVAFSSNNIGVIYMTQGEYAKALEYFHNSLKLSKEVGSEREISTSLYHIGEVYLRQGKVSEADVYAKKSMNIAKKLGYPLRIRDAAELLNEIYQKQDKWKIAHQTQELFFTMRDSIRNKETEKDAIKQQAKYDLEKKEQELEKSEQEVELLSSQNEIQELKLNRNRILIALFSIGFGLVSILVLLVFRGNKKKKVIFKLLKKQKEDITKQNEEKKVMLKEIHHRVKNNLQVVNSLLKFQSREIEDEKIIGMFNKAQKRVLSMAMLHEKLYRSDDLKNINIRDHFTVLAEDLIKNYAVGKKITLEVDIDDVDDISIETLTSLGLIISELITNSLKHAFKNTNEGIIIVSFKQVDNVYELIIGDDGVGFVPENKSAGLGTKLTQIFTKQLGGIIEIMNKPGTIYRLVFEKNR